MVAESKSDNHFKKQNGGSNMADQKFENCSIFIKMSIFKFLGVLNPNLKTELQIPDGGSNIADHQFKNNSIFFIFDPLY